MFIGSVGADLRSVIVTSVKGWSVPSVYVGCSGNFTVERSLAPLGYELSGNDVSLYSCCVGSYLAGQPFRIEVRDPEYEWLSPWLGYPASAVATILLSTQLLGGYGKTAPYYQRQRQAYKAQWKRLHAETLQKIELTAGTVHLKRFWAGDVLDWLEQAPVDAGFITFPPTYRGGYERIYRSMEAVFDWDEPSYEIFDEQRMALVRAQLVKRPYWLIARDEPQPDLGEAVAIMQSSARSKPLWVYGNSSGRRWLASPVQKTEGAGTLIADEALRIAEHTRLSIAGLSAAQFNELRSLYLNPGIVPVKPTASLAVLANGKIIGSMGFIGHFVRREVGRIYMLSDFPVRPTIYPRLAKLILAVALSTEVQIYLQQHFSGRVSRIGTTAFTERPVSSKYRGLFQLLSRKKNPPRLNYQAGAGRWSLEEALSWWMEKHGKMT